jgi:hypothetical protein
VGFVVFSRGILLAWSNFDSKKPLICHLKDKNIKFILSNPEESNILMPEVENITL